ncbi:hypothetical protein FS842_010701 [Serendipita sp. 407]|nr:hypothetical protein FS842_010701 [Serendipita sp. 407]
MAETSFYPSITPVKSSDVPSKQTLIDVMIPLLVESESWPAGRTYKEEHHGSTFEVSTFSRQKQAGDGAMWHGRASDHSKESTGGWDSFWQGIGVNHTAHEQEYFVELDQVKKLKVLNTDQEIWTTHYALRAPAGDRIFTVLVTTHVVTHPENGLRTGYVMTVPIDVSSEVELVQQEFRGTRGSYAAIEHVKELPDGGVNWRMITTSTPGGYIPQFIVEKQMPGKIKEDVAAFMGWLAKRREEAAGSSSATTTS